MINSNYVNKFAAQNNRNTKLWRSKSRILQICGRNITTYVSLPRWVSQGHKKIASNKLIAKFIFFHVERSGTNWSSVFTPCLVTKPSSHCGRVSNKRKQKISRVRTLMKSGVTIIRRCLKLIINITLIVYYSIMVLTITQMSLQHAAQMYDNFYFGTRIWLQNANVQE
jgi:hypothetical protein